MALSDEVQEMVLNSTLGARDVAEAVGKKYPVLLNEMNSENDRHKLGADMLIPLMNACNSVEPLRYLSERMGGVYIPLPETKDCEQDMINVVTEFGEFVAAYGRAIKDKKLTADEKDEIRKEGHEALTAIQGILCNL
ncbi:MULTISPECIES: phage regulatory CII family protein [unclassified Maridesulfovibrio]|uniref:phage regulatory CII family protein n=1 Tax=unclassified Maridesulfovibrio TaxID=2794999 RepID=UPI003B3D23C4